MESLDFENGSITALPFLGEHSDLNVHCKAAHLVRIGGRSLLHAPSESDFREILGHRHLPGDANKGLENQKRRIPEATR
jgi:hypothetical protein